MKDADPLMLFLYFWRNRYGRLHFAKDEIYRNWMYYEYVPQFWGFVWKRNDTIMGTQIGIMMDDFFRRYKNETDGTGKV